jgi:hypothetical protein
VVEVCQPCTGIKVQKEKKRKTEYFNYKIKENLQEKTT